MAALCGRMMRLVRPLGRLHPRRGFASSSPGGDGPSSPGGAEGEDLTAVHFRLTPHLHPLKNPGWKTPPPAKVWQPDELEAVLEKQPHLQPKSIVDRVTYACVRSAYHSFNFLSGYNHEDPSPRSVERRLLFLESFAGVPGMVAAALRHFRSLRTMHRDHGWIHTLLEEAENERLHLMVFMTMFSPGLVVRTMVIATQMVLVTVMTGVYVVYPRALHRFVGYLEESAVETYTALVKQVQTPGSKLHEAWKDLPAPPMAKAYWRLPDDARFLDVLLNIAADEAHHRDVNHTFAFMHTSARNPFVPPNDRDPASSWKEQLHH